MLGREIRAKCGELNRIVNRIESGADKHFRDEFRAIVAGTREVTLNVQVKIGGSVVGYKGTPVAMLLYKVFRLLDDVGPNRLRNCPAEDCGRAFVKITRKEYCSTRCQKKIYMRNYRALK